ncbi:Eukaryotic translation initiation factor 1A, partial [Cricetulus griseus]
KNRLSGKKENESEKARAGVQRGWARIYSGNQNVGKRTIRSSVFRWCKETVPYQREIEEKGLDKYLRHHIGLRDYQDNKAIVILKYNADEARSLKEYGELPEHAKINETDTFGPGDDDEIQFDDIGDDDKDIGDI